MARETAGALALEGRLAEVQQLGAGALAAADADGRTTLHWAASGGHLETVQYLMAAGLEVNATDDAGWTPAHVAVSSGHAPVVRALLAGGADGLIANATGQLPLHYACSRNRLECAQLLFREGGAGIDAEEATLMRACSRGHMQLTTWLIEAGANTTCTDHDGNTPLHLATIERDTSMVQ
jgi:26S proteasome non-ATPase regulatory subunit 10